MSLPFSLIGSQFTVAPKSTTSCRPNYFMGAPAIDNPSQKVVVADRLASTCGLDTNIIEMVSGGTGAALIGKPGGIVYAKTETELGITDAGDYGSLLASNGTGEPFWTNVNFPVVVGPAGTIIRSNGTDWVASTATFADTYPSNAVLFSNGSNTVTGDTGFTWNNTTQNLQPGTTGVSIGVSAGVATNAVAIGNLAGSFSQNTNSVAIGVLAGSTMQGTNSVAVGRLAGTFSQGQNAVAIGNSAGSYSQSDGSVAIGVCALTFQGTNAVAIGASAANISQGANSVAIGILAAQTAQGTACVAIGRFAGSITQGFNSVAIGNTSGQTAQGTNCVAIGTSAGLVTQGNSAVAIGNSAGVTAQASSCVAVGVLAGSILQGLNSIAIGNSAGFSTQGTTCVAVGRSAGQVNQGNSGVAIGNTAGATNQSSSAIAIGTISGGLAQGNNAIAIGSSAGGSTQGVSAVAVGNTAGQLSQGQNAVAIGVQAGQIGQGQNAIAIGAFAGQTSQVATSICINASGVALNPTQAGFYVNPVRTAALAANAVTLTYSNNEVVVNSGKTFVIDHPQKPETHYLVHACLEGPEAGVYYRGKGIIPKGHTSVIIELPEYVESLARHLMVHVTPIGVAKLLFSTDPEEGRFSVGIKKPVNFDVPFTWLVLGERKAIDVTVSKTHAKIAGSGPYQYLVTN